MPNSLGSNVKFCYNLPQTTHEEMEDTTEPVKKKARTAFQLAAVRNGLKGRKFGKLGKESGVKGKPFGSRGGRPKSKTEKAVALRDIEAFLRSSKLNPYFPPEVTSKEQREAFKTKCFKFRLHPSKSFLQKRKTAQGKKLWVRVAKPQELSRGLFEKYHFTEKGCSNTLGYKLFLKE